MWNTKSVGGLITERSNLIYDSVNTNYKATTTTYSLIQWIIYTTIIIPVSSQLISFQDETVKSCFKVVASPYHNVSGANDMIPYQGYSI
jgi:hypothetical protein